MKTMNYSLIRILFALVIGLVLVIWPNAAASYIVITVGVAFLIPGVISLFGYFGRKRPEGEAAPRFPIEGIGSLLFGLWLSADDIESVEILKDAASPKGSTPSMGSLRNLLQFTTIELSVSCSIFQDSAMGVIALRA